MHRPHAGELVSGGPCLTMLVVCSPCGILRYIIQGFLEVIPLESRPLCIDGIPLEWRPWECSIILLSFLSFSVSSFITHFVDKNHKGSNSLCGFFKVTMFKRNNTYLKCLTLEVELVFKNLLFCFLNLTCLLLPLQWLKTFMTFMMWRCQ